MDATWRSLLLVTASLLASVGIHLAQRRRAGRTRGRDADHAYRVLDYLAVFLPLVALLAMLQLYLEAPRDGYLALAGLAALALLIGLARFMDTLRDERRRRRPP